MGCGMEMLSAFFPVYECTLRCFSKSIATRNIMDLNTKIEMIANVVKQLVEKMDTLVERMITREDYEKRLRELEIRIRELEQKIRQ